MTTVHTTKSHYSSASVTKTSVCVCLNNVNKEPIQQVRVFVSRMFAMNISFWASVGRYVVREGTGI